MKRQITKELKKWKQKKDKKPLILKGARQVGKTYALNHFGKTHYKNYHYLNFEKNKNLKSSFEKDLEPNRILEELNFKLNTHIQESDLLIFDEIQECPNALTSLKYFHEEKPNQDITAAGSLIGVTLGESNFPVGKVEFLNLYPMNFEEFLNATNTKNTNQFLESITTKTELPESLYDYLWKKWKEYLIVGGLPDVINSFVENQENSYQASQIVREKQGALINMYTADIAKHSGKTNALHIERVWRNIANQLSTNTDSSTSKYKFKDVIPGIHRYSRLSGPINWLDSAGLILRTQINTHATHPLSAHTKESQFKLFMFDIGLLGCIAEIPPSLIMDYNFGSYKGYFAENYVAQELITKFQKPLYTWTENTAEVEFLIELDGNILPIEVKAGHITQAKSLKVYSQKYKPKFKTIISANPLKITKETHNYPLPLLHKFPLED